MWSIGKKIYQGTCTVYAFLCVVPILIPLVFTHTTTYSIFELVPWWTIQIFFMFSPCYVHSTGITFKMNSFKFFICDLFVVHSLFLYMPRYIISLWAFQYCHWSNLQIYTICNKTPYVLFVIFHCRESTNFSIDYFNMYTKMFLCLRNGWCFINPIM